MSKSEATIEKAARKQYHEKLGEYLKQTRLKSGCVQKIIADKAGLKTTQFISNIERGLCAVSPSVLRIMIKEYGIPKNEFLKFIVNLEMDYNKHVLFGSGAAKNKRKV